MSMFTSVPVAAARPARVCQNHLRMFSSSARTNEGAERTPFTALLDTMNKSNQTRENRPRQSLPLRTRPQDPSQPGRPNRNMFKVMEKSVQDIRAANRTRESQADIQRAQDRQDLERQLTRRWKSGDVYAPHDLSGVEMSKWRQAQPKGRSKKDVIDILNINPLDHYKNFAMMSEYMTEMGRIKHNRDTGLRPVNQRKMAKAVRRAIGLGLMPSVHRHPEILAAEASRRNSGPGGY